MKQVIKINVECMIDVDAMLKDEPWKTVGQIVDEARKAFIEDAEAEFGSDPAFKVTSSVELITV